MNSATATRKPHSTLSGVWRFGRVVGRVRRVAVTGRVRGVGHVGRVRRLAVTGGVAVIASLGLMSAANAQFNAQEAFQVVPPLVIAPTLVPTTVEASVLGAVVTTVAPTTAVPSTKAPVVVVPTALGNSIVAAPAIKTEVLGKTLTSPAFTGSNALPMALAGAALFGFGSVLVLSARRRTKTR